MAKIDATMVSTILNRELRQLGRARSTYYMRLFPSFGAMLLVVLLPERGGKEAFSLLATAAAVLFSCQALLVTSDTLSEERRAGTLGLLFLTPLSGLEIILGKAWAALLNTFYFLLALIPVFGVALLYGGVTGKSVLQIALALPSLIFCALATGLWVSTRGQHAIQSLGASFLIFLVWVVLPYTLDWLQQLWPGSLIVPLKGLSPWQALKLAIDSGRWGPFCFSLLSVQTVTWLLLWQGGRHLAQNRRDEEHRPRVRSWIPVLFKRGQETAGLRWRRRIAPKLEENALLWNTLRRAGSASWMWRAAILANLLFFGCLMVSHSKSFISIPLAVLGGWICSLALRLWLAAQATGIIHEMKRENILELILTTPLPPEHLVRGLTAGLWRPLRGPICLLYGGACLFLLMISMSSVSPGMLFPGLLFILAHGVLFLLDCWALIWMGLHLGLTQKTRQGAITRLLLYVWLGPAFCLLIPLGGLILAPIFILFLIRYGMSATRQYLGSWDRYDLPIPVMETASHSK